MLLLLLLGCGSTIRKAPSVVCKHCECIKNEQQPAKKSVHTKAKTAAKKFSDPVVSFFQGLAT